MLEHTTDFFSDAFSYNLDDQIALDVVLALTEQAGPMTKACAIYHLATLSLRQRNQIAAVMAEYYDDPDAWLSHWASMETQAFE